MPEITPATLQRLVAIDEALSKEGLHRGEMAKRLGVSNRTIQRDQELLRAVTGDDGVLDSDYRWYYSDRRRRVFTRWVARRSSGRGRR